MGGKTSQPTRRIEAHGHGSGGVGVGHRQVGTYNGHAGESSGGAVGERDYDVRASRRRPGSGDSQLVTGHDDRQPVGRERMADPDPPGPAAAGRAPHPDVTARVDAVAAVPRPSADPGAVGLQAQPGRGLIEG